MLAKSFRNCIAIVVITTSYQYCHILAILHNNLTNNVSFLKRLFVLGCAGSSLLYASFLQLQRVGVTLQLRCMGFSSRWLSCCRAQALGAQVSVVVRLSRVHRLSCSPAWGIFLSQELNPRPLHWQAHSYPLYHQGNPICLILIYTHQQSWEVVLTCHGFHSAASWPAQFRNEINTLDWEPISGSSVRDS